MQHAVRGKYREAIYVGAHGIRGPVARLIRVTMSVARFAAALLLVSHCAHHGYCLPALAPLPSRFSSTPEEMSAQNVPHTGFTELADDKSKAEDVMLTKHKRSLPDSQRNLYVVRTPCAKDKNFCNPEVLEFLLIEPNPRPHRDFTSANR